jgi:hypothetical protein
LFLSLLAEHDDCLCWPQNLGFVPGVVGQRILRHGFFGRNTLLELM